MSVAARVRQLGHDLRRVGGGVRTVLRPRSRLDDLDVCLARLRAEQPVARVGGPNAYAARIANPRRRTESVRLVFDFHRLDAEAPRHLGFVIADVPLAGLFVRDVLLRFDWAGRAQLLVDGVPAGELHLAGGGEVSPGPGLWRIALLARDPASGRDWHGLEIGQRVLEAAPCGS